MNHRPDQFPDEDDEKTFLERHRVVLSVVAVMVIGVTVVLMQKKFSSGASSRQKGSEIVSVRLPPPPPTPPPAAPTPPPQEIKQAEKMMDQAPVANDEQKPDDKPPEAAPVTTNNVGTGGPDFGLRAGTGGNVIGGGSARQASKWGWYAAQVQNAISDAMRKEAGVRTASLNLKVRIWPDASGRVTRAKLAGTTKDQKLDAALNAALTGLQLKEPPPQGMPLPIVLRISAQRP